MKKSLLLILTLIVCCTVFSQDNSQQLELQTDNDKLVLTDKYYTSGLFLTYRKTLNSSFVFAKTEQNKLQLNITLGNQTYTPTNLVSENPIDFDMPYSGWFYLKPEIGRIKNNSALFLGAEIGVSGPQALSGKFQTWWHETVNIDAPTWTQEIENKFLVNLKAKYLANTILGQSHHLTYQGETSLGTKDIFIKNGLTYYFGRFNEFKNSSRNGFVDSIITNEFFGLINIGHKYVLHNTLLQGSLDYKDETFTIDRTPHVFLFKVGSVLKLKRTTLKFMANYNTAETAKATSHIYGSISFSRDF